jgi:hypothetical protein
MDFVKKFAGGNNNNNQEGAPQQGGNMQQQQGSSSSGGGGGGFLSGISNKMNAAAGGGPESEKNEDYLDKGKLPASPTPFAIPQSSRPALTIVLFLSFSSNRRRLCSRTLLGTRTPE